MKTTLIITIIVAVIVAVGAGVGGFFGGKAYESNHANSVRNNFLRARGLNPNDFTNGSPNGATGTNGQTRGAFGGGTFGQIKSVNGNTLVVTTTRNTDVTVTLSNTTRIEKTSTGTTADLQTGEQVTVAGQRDSSGNITAVQVTILPASTQSASGTTP